MDLKERMWRWLDGFVNGSPPWMWTIEEAIGFTRVLDPVLREAGFTVGITGSILLNGQSGHDLDIIVYPISAPGSTHEQAAEALKKFGMRVICPSDYVIERWREKGSTDTKVVEIWRVTDKRWKGRRVDVFFLR